MNATGRKITISENDVAATASSTSLVPSTAARNGVSPSSSIFLKMFSSTTMASSITMPTASVRPSSVIVLRVRLSARISVKLAISDAGMASELMIVAGMLRMKSRTMRLARMLPTIRCSSSADTDAMMNFESSRVVTMVKPGGSVGWIVLIACLRPSMTVSVFWPDWRRMSMTIARCPETNADCRASASESATFATSATRIGVPPWVAMTMSLN